MNHIDINKFILILNNMIHEMLHVFIYLNEHLFWNFKLLVNGLITNVQELQFKPVVCLLYYKIIEYPNLAYATLITLLNCFDLYFCLYASYTSNSFLHNSIKTSSMTSPLLYNKSFGIGENKTREYFGI